MLGEKHDLLHEFPEFKEQIHKLKLENHYFLNKFNKYHEIDHEIRRIEEGVETPEDAYLDNLKKDRLYLKDELLAIINKT